MFCIAWDALVLLLSMLIGLKSVSLLLDSLLLSIEHWWGTLKVGKGLDKETTLSLSFCDCYGGFIPVVGGGCYS
jgi:hypothetical protein